MKTLFVVFGSFALLTSANAGPVDVTGTAKVTYNINGSETTTAKNDKGKAIGITNELAFTGTGETDQGWTWKYQVELDDNASGVTTFDDTRLEISTGMGAVAFYNTEGSLSAKYKQDHSAYGVGSDNGSGGLFTYGSNIGGYNNVQLHTGADMLPYGGSIKVGYSPSGNTSKNSGNSAGAVNTEGSGVVEVLAQVTPVDGLTISASGFQKEDEGGTKSEYESAFVGASFTAGNLSLGITHGGVSNSISVADGIAQGTALTAATLGNVAGFENDAWSIGYAVNDALSVSYGEETSKALKRTVTAGTDSTARNDVELKITTLQAAYTMGGFTTFVMAKDIENEAYALGVDQKETIVGMNMAF